MHLDTKKNRYPHSKLRVIWSAILAAMAVSLALLLLSDAVWVLIYFLSTGGFTAVIYILKTRVFQSTDGESSKESSDQTRGTRPYWQGLIIALLVLMGIAAFPLLLAGFVHAYVWFVLITSYIAGISIAEIMIYLRTK